MKRVNSWTPQEDGILRKNFRRMTDRELAELLPNRTHKAVRSRVKVLKLKRTESQRLRNRLRFIPNRRPEEHIDFVRKHMNEMSSGRIADALGKDKSYVKNILHDLRAQGIRISKEARDRFSRESRFKKGHIPFNKGMKGIRMSPHSEFKKGHIPVNTLHDGAIRLRTKKNGSEKYYFIRVAKMKWVLYHRYLWEKHHGSIPKGMQVAFKDGNSLNCSIENLEIITRAENMRRVRESDGYIAHKLTRDPELQEIIKNNPELLELKRAQLKQQRILRDAITSTDD